MRVGGTEPVKVDVRVICATNRDLAAAVKEGKFREDLYYRLNVIQIHLPPLRERTGDIADLVRHYVAVIGGPWKTVSPEAMSVLERYGWPGNVRELRNVVERMVVLSGHDRLEIEDLPQEVVAGGSGSSQSHGESRRLSDGAVVMSDIRPPTQSQTLVDVERSHIMSVLEACGGNKKLAAERLGISRSTLYEKMRGFGGGCTANGLEVSDTRTAERETDIRTQ